MEERCKRWHMLAPEPRLEQELGPAPGLSPSRAKTSCVVRLAGLPGQECATSHPVMEALWPSPTQRAPALLAAGGNQSERALLTQIRFLSVPEHRLTLGSDLHIDASARSLLGQAVGFGCERFVM